VDTELPCFGTLAESRSPRCRKRRYARYGAGSKNGPAPHPTTLELAQDTNFAVITTALPGGDFQNHYIWVGTEGERLFVNTEVHRQKFKNVQCDSRVTLTI
jgi:hypothetical protein